MLQQPRCEFRYASSVCGSGIAARAVGHAAILRPSTCRSRCPHKAQTPSTIRTASWNSNHHVIIPALQWAAAHPQPSQTTPIPVSAAEAVNSANNATTAANISSEMPEGRTVFNYRDGAESGAITSRSGAGVISIATSPADQTAVKPPEGQDTDKPAPQEDNGEQHKQFNWHKAWYPVAVIDHLDPAKPTPTQLLGMDLVLWRDSSGMWRAFQDCCPHRLAPLSEGRIDDKTGNLYCNYHGWQFNGSGACTHIPQLPSDIPINANPKRSCARSFPTTVCEDLLWVWGESGPAAAAEAAATPLANVAPEITQFGEKGYWQMKLFFHGRNYLSKWHQRVCNASYESVKENVFADPSHDTVLHHGLAGLDRNHSGPGEVLDFQMDEKSYTITRLNPTGRTVSEITKLPVGQRRSLGPTPDLGASIGYVTPMAPGKCNMFITLVRDPKNVKRPQGLMGLIWDAMPQMPEWYIHTVLHDVVDADVAMQHGVTVNSVRTDMPGYMPAIGMDQGPIAFTKWMRKYGGGGPFPKQERLAAVHRSISDAPRRQLLSRYDTHTKHCRYCSTALKNFKTLHKVSSQLFNILAAAAVGVAAVQLVQASQGLAGAAATSAGLKGVSASVVVGGLSALTQGVVANLALLLAAGVLGVCCLVSFLVSRWSERMCDKFTFQDYDHSHPSKQ